MDFADRANIRVKIKETKNIDNFFDFARDEKATEHEDGVDSNAK